MAEITVLSQNIEEPDLDNMDRDELLSCLKTVLARLDRLDEQEPEDMASRAYEDWGDRHEELEDLADELRDRLDELGGHHD